MTPKGKAEEIVELYCQLLSIRSYEDKSKATQCALIEFDAIISYCCADDVLFLHKVKEEIEKL